MRWIEEDDEYELASGRRIYANRGLLSIGRLGLGESGKWYIAEGYDGVVDMPGETTALTAEDRQEMADHMIARWAAYREAALEAR